MTGRPLVSVTIPCYHQLALARRAVASVLAQSYTDLEVTLVDDGASDEYAAYVTALGDARVTYRRNPSRLGAMRNMFQAIGAGTGEYAMAFHEDDLLGAHYVGTAVDFLERHPRCGFVAGQLREFHDEPSAGELAHAPDPPSFVEYESPADFVRGVCRGVDPMFGTVVYRRQALQTIAPDLDQYGTLADRPFLLDILRAWTGATCQDPLVWYRRHGDGDVRYHGMSAPNILALLRRYRAVFPPDMPFADRELFHFYTGYWLVTLYTLLPDQARPPLARFLLRAWREGLYDPRAQRGRGRREILRAILRGRPL